MKEAWLFPGSVVPVDMETTTALVAEIKRLIDVVGGMALAQPEQEPVALDEYDAGLLNGYGGGKVEWWQDYIRAELGRAYEYYQSQIITPPKPKWVGLTDEEKHEIRYSHMTSAEFIEFIEAKLKEKNT